MPSAPWFCGGFPSLLCWVLIADCFRSALLGPSDSFSLLSPSDCRFCFRSLLRALLIASDPFWVLLIASDAFRVLLIASDAFRALLIASDAFRVLLIACDPFGVLLIASAVPSESF